MPDQPNILVVGSVNMDLVVRCAAMPAPGETVLGDAFCTSPGGKGANQAVAAARLGARCTLIGRVGDDAFGRELLDNLTSEDVDCEHVLPTPEARTGAATIVVDGNGDNAIVVAGGANRSVTPDDLFTRAELFAAADVVLLQLELTLPTVRAAIDLARRHGCRTVLDPAPAPCRPAPGLYDVDVLTPNAQEAEALTGVPTGDQRANKNVASELIALGAKAVALKLAGRGSLVVCADGEMARLGAYKVTVTDTTAAGDAFTAALGVSLARGSTLRVAARYANAAGALACTRIGAQAAMPTADEVAMLMADQTPEP
ncbi:MAG: ribokinase [Phycisphaerae bacterium]|nr:ribokinase [Phycisphaerae bacterium]